MSEKGVRSGTRAAGLGSDAMNTNVIVDERSCARASDLQNIKERLDSPSVKEKMTNVYVGDSSQLKPIGKESS